jgi:hypothetical protein
VAVLAPGTGRKALELISAPKERGPRTLRLFPCKPGRFKGPPEGAMIAVVDPGRADAVMVGEGHAPLWQYLSRLLKAGTRIFEPKGKRSTAPSSCFSC